MLARAARASARQFQREQKLKRGKCDRTPLLRRRGDEGGKEGRAQTPVRAPGPIQGEPNAKQRPAKPRQNCARALRACIRPSSAVPCPATSQHNTRNLNARALLEKSKPHGSQAKRKPNECQQKPPAQAACKRSATPAPAKKQTESRAGLRRRAREAATSQQNDAPQPAPSSQNGVRANDYVSAAATSRDLTGIHGTHKPRRRIRPGLREHGGAPTQDGVPGQGGAPGMDAQPSRALPAQTTASQAKPDRAKTNPAEPRLHAQTPRARPAQIKPKAMPKARKRQCKPNAASRDSTKTQPKANQNTCGDPQKVKRGERRQGKKKEGEKGQEVASSTRRERAETPTWPPKPHKFMGSE